MSTSTAYSSFVGSAPRWAKGVAAPVMAMSAVNRFVRRIAGRTRGAAVAVAGASLLAMLPVAAQPAEAHTTFTYKVVYNGSIVVDKAVFERTVAATFEDYRGWKRAGVAFRRVPASSGSHFTVVLAQASRVPTYSSACSSRYSCRVGRYVIINQDRWRYGVLHWPSTLTSYRQMVINHETGHWLGLGHRFCTGAGRPAPVMQQQSKSLSGCKANAWPTSAEVSAVSRLH